MPQLTLIQPLFDNAELDRNQRTLYPLGLGYLAAYVPERWTLELVDEQIEAVDLDAETDLVGISTTTLTINRAYELADAFRARGVPVVLGGIHASVLPDEALEHCDAVCIGDGETLIAQICEDAARGTLRPRYQAEPGTLAGLRTPRRDIFSQGYSFLPVSTSRGCPFDCAFCAIHTFYGGRYRHRPVGEVLDELRSLPRGHRVVFFTDGNLYGYSARDRERFMELCRGIAALREAGELPFQRWTAYGSVNTLDDPEALDLAASAGCLALFGGFESINPASLEEMGKRLNLRFGVESYRRLVRNAQERGLLVVGEMIVGADADEPEVLADTAAFLRAIDFDLLRLQIMQPLPGTRLFERLQEQGRLHLRDFPADWRRLCEGFTMGVHFDTVGCSGAELQRWVKATGLEFYRPSRIARRAARVLRLTRSPALAATTVVMNLKSRRTYAGAKVPSEGRT
jgi:radical SAM superfamily enzyme YgiQ (UPF0313 family)